MMEQLFFLLLGLVIGLWMSHSAVRYWVNVASELMEQLKERLSDLERLASADGRERPQLGERVGGSSRHAIDFTVMGAVASSYWSVSTSRTVFGCFASASSSLKRAWGARRSTRPGEARVPTNRSPTIELCVESGVTKI